MSAFRTTSPFWMPNAFALHERSRVHGPSQLEFGALTDSCFMFGAMFDSVRLWRTIAGG
jgi:hypothetical protein